MKSETSLQLEIPEEIRDVVKTLNTAGYEAYLVGGCVRDLLIGNTPKDWDVTTNATPEQITESFPKTFYENTFGTVGVVNEYTEDETRKIVEVTPYRTESEYSDGRHPDEVRFSQVLQDDLKRRDFTMNALAYNPVTNILIDEYNGIKDIHDAIIRTVGDPYDRFNEDALRILRAVRLSCQLSFTINTKTQEALKKSVAALEQISKERIRDEFIKIVDSKEPMKGLILAHELDVLKYVLPDLERGIGIDQNGDHIYTVWEHNIRALQHAANRDWPLHVKLAALLHDISKPETRRWAKEKNDYTFYGHDVVGGKVAKKIMQDLRMPKTYIHNVSKLVRYHLFFSDIDKITLSAVRRIVRNVGPELVWDLMKVRACDRIGMGRPKEQPYRLRKYESMIEEAMRAPVSVGMLKIDGKKIMEVTRETPGPKLGYILNALLELVLTDPTKNTEEYLESQALTLNSLPINELKELSKQGSEMKDEKEEAELKEIRKRHKVK